MPVPYHVHLVDYDPAWPEVYAEERDALEEALGSNAQRIEHVGSTAVPGLVAKPTIDIAVTVRSLGVVADIATALRKLGYEYLGEYGLPNRHFFRRPKEEPECGTSFHVHVALEASPHMIAWLAFRDLLREDPELRKQYTKLKLDLAKRYHDNRPAYTAAKSAFIEAQVRRALFGC